MISPKTNIAIIGLGYVGLPLAVAFGRQYSVVGFDVNRERVEELRRGQDITAEVTSEEMQKSTGLSYSDDPKDIRKATVYIVTVPTPIDQYKKPDLRPPIQCQPDGR